MTPADALDMYRRQCAENGSDITVRRYSGTGAARAVAQEAVVRGRVVGAGPVQLVGEIAQSGRRVILLNDPAAAVPARKVALSTLLPLGTTDRLVLRGAEVAILDVDDDTVRINDVLIALKIIAEG